MNKLHPFTFLGVITALGAVALDLGGIGTWPMLLAIAAYGSTLLEFRKYTSRFQFIVLLGIGTLLGLFADLRTGTAPIMSASLFVVALATIARQAFMQRFTHVNLLWVEPVALVLALTGYFHANLAGASDQATWMLPLMPFGFAAGLFFSYVHDGLLMKRSLSGGYRIQAEAPAPDFTLADENGQLVRLSDLRGQAPVLLLFVRGDWCPGCHMMLRTYEKHRDVFQRKGVVLLAIGPDAVATNSEMAERIGVNFRLLSDADQRVSSTYGVVYSNPLLEAGIDYREGIPLPASFLIDIHGVVRYVSRPERVGEFLRPERVFEVLQRMPDGADPSERTQRWQRA